MAEAEMVNPAIGIIADRPNRPGIGFGGLWLQTVELEALRLLLVLLAEVGILRHGGVYFKLLGNG